ncbi:DedA family protein [Campylobacter volucris]|uniref:DedA family protein n=1 Tax=Campylobacter volucris TaxID=1031542 RepID=A0AAE5YH41_9BACT|nr:YqaA family protein [Campylobacter volucris]AJC94621.1 putative membrane protein, YqaA family (SNARE domain) [Campylobacter volucris LMG 24379]KAB0579482.1 DedA family protein [Campylobacter volucris]MBF7042579.1 DedA family protein [Campylobacter volucris]MBF7045456.1 DedA family protein [Campylobacter volucris]MBF7049053.1 DedA family protein [Campylobacter volucris]
MFEFLYSDISYIGLFIVSFLSSTLLPMASEAFVIAFVKLDFNIYCVLFVATLANTLGSLSTYALAYFGKSQILEKYFKNSIEKLDKFNANFKKFGFLYAFFTFLPVVGDIFSLGLGFAKYSFLKSCVFIALGKLTRYIFVIFIANSI